MPLVIDTLNMPKQMDHQLASYGKYSDMIRDYTARKLVPMPKTDEAKKLWQMVDPWAYRAKLKMPKMIVNGTNDPYWTQDALNLYWDDLVGDKWVSYVPNAGHNLAQMKEGKPDLTRARGMMAAFAYAMIHGKALPKQTWKHGEADGKYTLSVTTNREPKAARLWVADAKTKDFRKSTWKSEDLTVAKTGAKAEVTAPASGCRVFFVECEYDLDGLRYHLSTQVRIVGKPAETKKNAE
jgi:PhoPQ-activated pathogenicity-related protein